LRHHPCHVIGGLQTVHGGGIVAGVIVGNAQRQESICVRHEAHCLIRPSLQNSLQCQLPCVHAGLKSAIQGRFGRKQRQIQPRRDCPIAFYILAPQQLGQLCVPTVKQQLPALIGEFGGFLLCFFVTFQIQPLHEQL